jgi:hypothetical protein
MRFTLFFLCLFSLSSIQSQHLLSESVGVYSGHLKLCQAGIKCDSVPFELSIQATKDPLRYNTKTTYLIQSEQNNVKDYDLILDTNYIDNNHYLLDEKDGILIQETKAGNTLYSIYTVEGNVFHVTTSYYKAYIDFELVVYDMNTIRKSQSSPDQNNEVYIVETYPFITVQKGRLYKK